MVKIDYFLQHMNQDQKQDSPIVANRREKLRLWIKNECGNSQAVFIEKTGINQGELSGLLKDKSFGEKKARKLEGDARMPDRHLDEPVDAEYTNNKNTHLIAGERIPSYNSVTIKQYKEVGGSMGLGIVLQDQPGQIVNIEVTDEWFDKNVPSNTGKKNLCIVTGFGDSMKGMFNPGDPLLVDIGINKCDHDGVYFFRVGEEGFVKRLQRIPGVGIKVISKNPDYDTWVITKDMEFQVLGKVLRVWESTIF